MKTIEECLKPYEQEASDGCGGYDTVIDKLDCAKAFREYLEQFDMVCRATGIEAREKENLCQQYWNNHNTNSTI